MPFAEVRLLPGETVVDSMRPHWIALLRPAAAAVILALGGWAIMGYFAVLGALVLGAAGALAGLAVAQHHLTRVTLTTRRIVITSGLLSRHRVDVVLGKIKAVEVTESLLGQLLGYGSVVVHGTGATPEALAQIARAFEFSRHVQQQLVGGRGRALSEPSVTRPRS